MKTWNLTFKVTIGLVVLALGFPSSALGQSLAIHAGPGNAQPSERLGDDDHQKSLTPPGLYITPKALAHAVQQDLNPGPTNHRTFVASQALKAVASPDGKTLAILTAGMNSLSDPTGVVDKAASTQFVFLYDISGANKTDPVLKQVIHQLATLTPKWVAPDNRFHQYTLLAGGE